MGSIGADVAAAVEVASEEKNVAIISVSTNLVIFVPLIKLFHFTIGAAK